MASRCRMLRDLIEKPELGFLMEAHNGLSAKIAEEAGFDAIWASGLSMSAALGVRDNNEATWTQLLEVLEFMADATSIPILVDGDTGFGDFNTMRRVVRKLESRGVAGVCIEDKLFPKTNSFIRGESQPLADIDEFAGKIRAGQDAKTDEDFVIVARVEAFIAGWGLSEALRRAEAYHEAGADAILMHSSRSEPDEVLSFARQWDNRCPVILVPTKYYTTPTDVFRQHNIAAVIWANHLMRTCITAMRQTAKSIFDQQNLIEVEDRVCSVKEVFALQGADELLDAERMYLPGKEDSVQAIVLAFTRGEEMGTLTADRPKAMVPVGGKPILHSIVETFRRAGIKRVGVAVGYRGDSVHADGIEKLPCQSDGRRDDVLALRDCRDALSGETLICYGDVLFRKFIASSLADCNADFAIMVDTAWRQSRNRDRLADYVVCDRDPASVGFYETIRLCEVTEDADADGVVGEWMGFLRLSKTGSEICRKLIDDWLAEDPSPKDADMAALLNRLVAAGHEIKVLTTAGHWIDCDSIADAVEGGEFA